jgi:putative component of membrane protein insertase Oxa1/YidC/SpoIIIJ protein YidD
LSLLLLVVAVACLAVLQKRAAERAELLVRRVAPENDAGQLSSSASWWTKNVGKIAMSVFLPHSKLIPAQKLRILNPGELSGDLKDPDDPWGYATPRCRGLPTCSDSTSSPAIKRHQQGMKKGYEHHTLQPHDGVRKQGLRILNPGELSGDLKDPDDPWGYATPRCRGLPTCSDSTSSPAITRHTPTQKMRSIKIKEPHSLDAIIAQEHQTLAHLEGVKAQGLRILNPGELSGELKDPDDPWGYSHPRCRGLPTCSDSTSSPAVKRHQQGMMKAVRQDRPRGMIRPDGRSPDGHVVNPYGRTNPPGVGHPLGAARKLQGNAHKAEAHGNKDAVWEHGKYVWVKK